MVPRPSLRKCGSKKLISKKARGNSFGNSSSFQYAGGGGGFGCFGTNLFVAFRYSHAARLADRAGQDDEQGIRDIA